MRGPRRDLTAGSIASLAGGAAAWYVVNALESLPEAPSPGVMVLVGVSLGAASGELYEVLMRAFREIARVRSRRGLRWAMRQTQQAVAQDATRDATPRFTCPRCGKVSHHPRDLQEGYCGLCHDWTAPPA